MSNHKSASSCAEVRRASWNTRRLVRDILQIINAFELCCFSSQAKKKQKKTNPQHFLEVSSTSKGPVCSIVLHLRIKPSNKWKWMLIPVSSFSWSQIFLIQAAMPKHHVCRMQWIHGGTQYCHLLPSSSAVYPTSSIVRWCINPTLTRALACHFTTVHRF